MGSAGQKEMMIKTVSKNETAQNISAVSITAFGQKRTLEETVTGDQLTKRERMLYVVLHAIGIAWGIGCLLSLAFGHRSPTYAEACLASVPCLLVPIFGHALRQDTRVIHGIRWLRE